MKKRKKLLVLVHGLGANGNEWWGKTKHSIENVERLNGFDTLFFDYETSASPTSIFKKLGNSLGATDRRETVPQAGQKLWSDMLKMMHNNQYSDVYFLGHSMGGIVIAAAIDHAFKIEDPRHPPLIDAIKKIGFVASPISGAKLASKAAWLYCFLGSNDHIDFLRPESDIRENLVSRFVDELLINRQVPLHIFRAQKDSAVSENELTEEIPIPKGIKIRFDVLDGGHSECIQDLRPLDDNFEKLLMWINPTKVDLSEVSPDEKVEDELKEQGNNAGNQAAGPGGDYLINETPIGWTANILSNLEYLNKELGIENEPAQAQEEQGSENKNTLVFTSKKVNQIIPSPMYSTLNGRPLLSALETKFSSEFVVMTVPKTRPPLYFTRSIDTNVSDAIGHLVRMGTFRLISQDAGVLSKSKREYRSAEFVQEFDGVTLNDIQEQNLMLRIQIYAVEGYYEDHFLWMKSLEVDGNPFDRQELVDMQRLFNSFTLLGVFDTQKKQEEAEKKANESQAKFINDFGQVSFLQQWSIFLERYKSADFATLESRLEIVKKIKPFVMFAKYVELDKGSFVSMINAQQEAENGNLPPLLAVLIEQRDQYLQDQDKYLSSILATETKPS